MFHVLSIRAAVAAELGKPQVVGEHVEALLAMPLRQITSLTPSGIASCLARLWSASVALGEQHPLRRRLEDHLLASGLATDAFWDFYRAKAAVTHKLAHFWVTLRQPLDQRWRLLAVDTCEARNTGRRTRSSTARWPPVRIRRDPPPLPGRPVPPRLGPRSSPSPVTTANTTTGQV